MTAVFILISRNYRTTWQFLIMKNDLCISFLYTVFIFSEMSGCSNLVIKAITLVTSTNPRPLDISESFKL